MATRTKSTESSPTEGRSPFSIIIVILIVAALGFFAFDRLTNNASDQSGDQTNEEEENGETGNGDNNNNGGDDNDNETDGNANLPANYKVASGDSLWKIAEHFYQDGYKWTVIAQENNLINPDSIHVGNVLEIPKIEVSAPVDNTDLPTSHTVVRGDTLWELAQKHYGSGYEWYRIRDANAGKVGKLPNGRPLIEIGSVLTIPAL